MREFYCMCPRELSSGLLRLAGKFRYEVVDAAENATGSNNLPEHAYVRSELVVGSQSCFDALKPLGWRLVVILNFSAVFGAHRLSNILYRQNRVASDFVHLPNVRFWICENSCGNIGKVLGSDPSEFCVAPAEWEKNLVFLLDSGARKSENVFKEERATEVNWALLRPSQRCSRKANDHERWGSVDLGRPA